MLRYAGFLPNEAKGNNHRMHAEDALSRKLIMLRGFVPNFTLEAA